MATKFWMVWAYGGRAPSYRHTTEESARTEAERLCRENSAEFIVLEAVACVKKLEPPVLWDKLEPATELLPGIGDGQVKPYSDDDPFADK